MTDNEDLDTGEGQSSYAKLRASLKEKYESQINDLQSRLDAEIASRATEKKAYFKSTLESQGYKGDFDEFADKYSSLGINEMVAMFKGMNGAVPTAPVSVPATNEQSQQEQLGGKSVIGTNPTSIGEKTVEQMTPQEYLSYVKTQMGI